ncbi:group II intron reverse transcriptase/maturase [Actinomadura sp. KC06]|uniref:group II intron reverse transcriptase/maturase n=1 Tax=Actinomadura sp. KC06 TaxID=2530369 RepID=UPI001A9E71A7|nr:group II intron reverse transcriptase/maturase [Actinomadura sp. KC06]
MWDAIDWRLHEENVRRLRQRIFKAAQDGCPAKLRNLQKLMLRSWSNTLVSVRQATQLNAGRKTAGVDEEVALTPSARMEMAMRVHRETSTWRPRPVKRVHIPKAGNRAKLRPLGIPVIADRCHQGRVCNALEPEWEARFEPRSYGFRPGRSCHDAIGVFFTACAQSRTKRVWVLDADLAAAFDKIDHSRLLEAIGSFPAKELIRHWLKAGVIEAGKGFAPTDAGTPQGGVISPLLLNVALHGLETAAGVRYYPASHNQAGRVQPGSPMVIRYADDLVALCHSQRQAELVKAKIAEWLAPKGLTFNEEKTRIVHIDDGYDFLGFNIRRYSGTLLIKPSKAAIQRIRERLRVELRALRGANAAAVIARINPIIRGWAAYYRGVVSSGIFTSLDHYLWVLCYKWATYRHATKSKNWVVARYFGKFNKFRNDQWVFGDAASGAYLVKMSWTPIVRHTKVNGTASPDDPALAEYWAKRRRRVTPPLDSYTLRLLTRQDGRCSICRGPLLTDDQPQSTHEWERWWLHIVRRAISADHLVHHGRPSSPDGDQTRLVHAACQRELLTRQRSRTACKPAPPSAACLR